MFSYYSSNKYNDNYSISINYVLDRLKDNVIHSRTRLRRYFNLTYDYFITLTFSPSKIGYQQNNIEIVQKCLQKFFKDLKNKARYFNIDYYILLLPDFATFEQGIHFHGLLYSTNYNVFNLVDSGHLYKSSVIYNLDLWQFGFTTAISYDNNIKAKNYISKYISKYKNKLLNHRYYFATNLNRKNLLKGD